MEQWRACNAAFEAWEVILPESDDNDLDHWLRSEEHGQLDTINRNAWNLLHRAQVRLNPKALHLPQTKTPYIPLYFLHLNSHCHAKKTMTAPFFTNAVASAATSI